MVKQLSEMNWEEKLQDVLDYHPVINEHEFYLLYKEAIEKKDETATKDLEQYGTSVRKICMNLYHHKKNCEFGWNDFQMDENGWIVRHKFEEFETIKFPIKKEMIVLNKLEIGRGPNGVWTYGTWISTSNFTSGCFGMSVFSLQFSSKQEAMVAGMQYIYDYMDKALKANAIREDKGNCNVASCNAVMEHLKERIDLLTGKVAVQLELF